MKPPRFEIAEQPDPGLHVAIFNALVKLNVHEVGPAIREPLAILLRNSDGDAIVGGLWAGSVHDWRFIDILYVHDGFRGCGFGSSLMKSAENVAARRGCIGVRLDTFDFQAPDFYEKLGYQAFGSLVNHPKGHEQIYYF